MKMINWGRDGASLSVSDPCDERCLDRGLKPEEGRGLLLLSDCLSSTPSTQAPASYDPRVENKQWTLGSWDWMEGEFPLEKERPLNSLICRDLPMFGFFIIVTCWTMIADTLTIKLYFLFRKMFTGQERVCSRRGGGSPLGVWETETWWSDKWWLPPPRSGEMVIMDQFLS